MRHLKPSLVKPKNFDSFWAHNVQAIRSTPAAINILETTEITPGLSYSTLSFVSLNQVTIKGYLLTWKNKKAPLVIHTNGYNGQYQVQLNWAKRGVHVLGFDSRGFGRSGAAPALSPHGHVLTGIESSRSSILTGAVCDYIQSHRVAMQLLGDNISRSLYYGFSFAGAMAIQAAAVGQLADQVFAGVPTFGWFEKRSSMNLSGSAGEINRYLQSHPEYKSQVLNTLNYFDTVHFANLLTCPTVIGVGLKDNVVPPETVYAIANHLTCRHKVMEFPESHANNDEITWHRFIEEMIKAAKTGGLLKSGSLSDNTPAPSVCDPA